MKRKIAGLYDPYIDTLGGGEKHILSILKVLTEEGYEINIFWDKDLSKQLADKFPLQLFNKLKFIPSIFTDHQPIIGTLKTLQTLKTFDYFFYVTDGSYFFSGAKNNFVFCMVPQKNLYSMNLLNKLKTNNFRFISNSQYTKHWLEKWGIKNDYIYPYIDEALIDGNVNKKEKIILSVGRFFPHLHSKQHEMMINTFKQLKQSYPEFGNYKLILAGGLKKEDNDYFEKLKQLIKNDPSISLQPNIQLYKLYKLYKLSSFYWHFTGYGVDADKHPELVEHLGITPLEAMAAGAISFCYAAGGPKEIITDGENGYLFMETGELADKMSSLINNAQRQQSVKDTAQKYVRQNFSYAVFRNRVKKLILDH